MSTTFKMSTILKMSTLEKHIRYRRILLQHCATFVSDYEQGGICQISSEKGQGQNFEF